MTYNTKNHVTPHTITKSIRKRIIEKEKDLDELGNAKQNGYDYRLREIKKDSLTPFDKKRTIKRLEREMKKAAEEMNFEVAILLREKVKELRT